MILSLFPQFSKLKHCVIRTNSQNMLLKNQAITKRKQNRSKAAQRKLISKAVDEKGPIRRMADDTSNHPGQAVTLFTTTLGND